MKTKTALDLFAAAAAIRDCPTQPGKDGAVLVIADFDKLMALCDALAAVGAKPHLLDLLKKVVNE